MGRWRLLFLRHEPREVWMGTIQTIHTAGSSLHRLVKPAWQFDFLARSGEELRSHATSQLLVLAPEFERQIAVFRAKHLFGLKPWPLASLNCDGPVACDAKFVRPRDSEHFDPRQHGRDDDGMWPVDCERIERLQPRERLAILSGEANVIANVVGGSARFHTAYDVSFGSSLVFQAQLGLSVDRQFAQAVNHRGRE